MASQWSMQGLMANRNLHVAWCTGGIMLSLMVYSVLQVPTLCLKDPSLPYPLLEWNVRVAAYC